LSNCHFDISDRGRQHVQMENEDRKSALILDSALPVFARYGFQKTTMADIARATGISRASLYLAFNSKEELFRAGSARAHERTMSEVEDALGRTGDVVDRIAAAISAFQEGLIAPFSKSENAKELFDTNLKLAKDITIAARSKLLDLLANALAAAQAQGEIDLKALEVSPADLAALIAAAMDGIKHSFSADGPSDYALRLLMRVLRLALKPEEKNADGATG
jgi:AcrR family transcriptional regulator